MSLASRGSGGFRAGQWKLLNVVPKQFRTCLQLFNYLLVALHPDLIVDGLDGVGQAAHFVSSALFPRPLLEQQPQDLTSLHYLPDVLGNRLGRTGFGSDQAPSL